MHAMRRKLGLLATILLPLITTTASAEYHPPPTLEEMANAHVIVQGCYKLSKRGEPEFVIEKFIAGNAYLAKGVGGSDVRVKDARSGAISCEVASASPFGFQPSGMLIDATRSRLWFLGVKKAQKVVPPGQIAWVPMVEPKELADGFLAIRNKQDPSCLFRVLQEWDESMRRDAMEEIVAGKDAKTLERLRAIGADPRSEVSGAAVQAILAMRLFDADRHWESWTCHPWAFFIGDELMRLDRARMAKQLMTALRKPDDNPHLSSLLQFSHLISDDEWLPTLAPLLQHKSETIRGEVTRLIGYRLAQFHREHGESKEAEARFTDFERAFVPLLKRLADDDADRQVHLCALRALEFYKQPSPKPEAEPALEYRAEDNFKLLLDQLTSHTHAGERQRRAGQELARYEFDAALAELKRRLASDEFNHHMVMDGIGYLRDAGKMPPDARSLALVRAHLRKHEAGASTFAAAVRAAARLKQKDSLAVIHAAMEQNKQHLDYTRAEYYLDALAELDDHPTAIAEIRRLEPHAQYRATLKYVKALARHGDPRAIELLLNAADGNAGEAMLKDTRWWSVPEVVDALRYVDGPEATTWLKRAVDGMWPTRERAGERSFGFQTSWDDVTGYQLHNDAGDAVRATIVGEVGRRDPQWLAGEALKRMASDYVPERGAGYCVFRALTGRTFDFDPNAFHAQRQPPLNKLQTWWKEHGGESRDEWLLSLFAERGFELESLDDRAAIPTLVAALDADPLTHALAIEQLERITDLAFDVRPRSSYRGQEYTTAMVTGKLRARGWLP